MNKEKIASLASKLVLECNGDYSVIKNAVEEAMIHRELVRDQIKNAVEEAMIHRELVRDQVVEAARSLFKGQTVPLRMAAGVIAATSNLNWDQVYDVLRTTFPVAKGKNGGVHIPAV